MRKTDFMIFHFVFHYFFRAENAAYQRTGVSVETFAASMENHCNSPIIKNVLQRMQVIKFPDNLLKNVIRFFFF